MGGGVLGGLGGVRDSACTRVFEWGLRTCKNARRGRATPGEPPPQVLCFIGASKDNCSNMSTQKIFRSCSTVIKRTRLSGTCRATVGPRPFISASTPSSEAVLMMAWNVFL